MKKQPISLAIGTEIALTKHASHTWASWIQSKDALIVTDVSAGSGSLEYAVNGCAWFNHRDLKWVADPTKKSLDFAVYQATNEDDEGEEEDDGEGGYVTVPRPKKPVIKRHKDAIKAMAGLKLKSRHEGDVE